MFFAGFLQHVCAFLFVCHTGACNHFWIHAWATKLAAASSSDVTSCLCCHDDCKSPEALDAGPVRGPDVRFHSWLLLKYMPLKNCCCPGVPYKASPTWRRRWWWTASDRAQRGGPRTGVRSPCWPRPRSSFGSAIWRAKASSPAQTWGSEKEAVCVVVSVWSQAWLQSCTSGLIHSVVWQVDLNVTSDHKVLTFTVLNLLMFSYTNVSSWIPFMVYL